MPWNPRRKGGASPTGITTFIDEGCDMQGTYSFSGTGAVLLDGRFQGEIRTTGALIVGERAVVRATIRAESVLIMGEVVGDVRAKTRVELKGTAVVVVEEGVVFEGKCRTAAMQPGGEVQAAPVVA